MKGKNVGQSKVKNSPELINNASRNIGRDRSTNMSERQKRESLLIITDPTRERIGKALYKAGVHMDGIVKNPALEIDDDVVIKDGMMVRV